MLLEESLFCHCRNIEQQDKKEIRNIKPEKEKAFEVLK